VKHRDIGVFVVGINGAIGTSLTTGVLALQKKLIQPFGLVSELAPFNLLTLTPLDRLRFYGWDLRDDSHSRRAEQQRHIPRYLFNKVRSDLSHIEIFPAEAAGVSPEVLSLFGYRSSRTASRMGTVQTIRRTIERVRKRDRLEGALVVNLASTEPKGAPSTVHTSIAEFEAGLRRNDPAITAAMLYAYAAISSDCPYVNFTPTIAAEIPALIDFAKQRAIVTAGKDGKTGQTLYKSVIAQMFSWRNLRVKGWYSANLLGNDDGYILQHPRHLQQKLSSKASGLSSILGYDDVDHQVNIDYYRPRGDAKEAWDAIDFVGWLGIPMSMRINWLGQDSALAAPLVVDLIRLTWHSQMHANGGPACHLASFFKTPIGSTQHGFFDQMKCLFEYCQNHSRKSVKPDGK
jgi:myo-inositol-1-phosphate synthase